MGNERRKIIYAEDNAVERQIVSRAIAMYFPKHDIEIHEDGYSLDKRLREGTPDVDLVITDNELRSGDGFDGLDIIKRYSGRNGVSPILLFCSAGDDIEKRAEEYRAFGFVPKGTPIKGLVSLAQEALNSGGKCVWKRIAENDDAKRKAGDSPTTLSRDKICYQCDGTKKRGNELKCDKYKIGPRVRSAMQSSQ